MDRDGRFDRVKRAYDAIVHGVGERADDPVAAVRARYEAGETDEFIEPIVIGDPARGRIRAGDTAIFFNFRPDRARELTRALTDPGFAEFDRGASPPLPAFVQMTEYAEDIHVPVAFAGEPLTDVLASTLAMAGIAQVHAAETEKYAHVTYFFDGGSEHRQRGEQWELVPSRRDVATYDLAPGMSAEGVAERFCAGIASPEVGFGLVNFANPDMVGHTGVIPAAVEAVQTTDRCLAQVVEAVDAQRRDLPRDGRPRERGGDAERRRQPQHRPHHEPGAVHRHPGRAEGIARRRPAGGRGSDGARVARRGPAGRHEGDIPRHLVERHAGAHQIHVGECLYSTWFS